MSQEFFKRLREYADPMCGPHGASSGKSNLDYWSKRASENSDGHKHRASGKENPSATEKETDPPRLPPDREMKDRDSSMRPFVKRSVDAILKEARSDPDHYGSDFMKSTRRSY